MAHCLRLRGSKGLNWKTRHQLSETIFHQRFKLKNPDFIGVDLAREDLANIIGTSKESLSRSLNALKKEKLITVNKRVISITNEAKIEKFDEFECAYFRNLDIYRFEDYNIVEFTTKANALDYDSIARTALMFDDIESQTQASLSHAEDLMIMDGLWITEPKRFQMP